MKFLHTKWPPFLGVHIKKDLIVFEPTPSDSFFQRSLIPNAPYFRSPVGTCTLLPYSRAPGTWYRCHISQSPNYQTSGYSFISVVMHAAHALIVLPRSRFTLVKSMGDRRSEQNKTIILLWTVVGRPRRAKLGTHNQPRWQLRCILLYPISSDTEAVFNNTPFVMRWPLRLDKGTPFSCPKGWH